MEYELTTATGLVVYTDAIFDFLIISHILTERVIWNATLHTFIVYLNWNDGYWFNGLSFN
ncbi:hypothetical protein KHA80_08335 [Anaerobacillus sp. HL2]|nr:hypothetical protein KHA80_08335 [Anaerobacillus sp. HL2]